MAAVVVPNEGAFGDLCLLCMKPCNGGSVYRSLECEEDDAARAHGPPQSELDSPVPPLVPAGGSSSCSSTPSSTNNSPHQLALLGHEEPSSLALPPSLASKAALHFNYRYSYAYGTSPKEGGSPPFAPSSAGRSSSATPEGPRSIASTLTSLPGHPQTSIASTAPPLTLPGRRTSLVSPRLRPIGPSPHASPALRPLTALSNLTLQRSRLTDSPPIVGSATAAMGSRSVGAESMARRASMPLDTTFESDNEADDEANTSAFAHYLFAKSRRSSELDSGRRRAGTAAPSTSPTSRSESMDRTVGIAAPRRYLFGRATPSAEASGAEAEGEENEPTRVQPTRGRSRQRQEGSSVYRSVSPKLRARSGSGARDPSPQEGVFERGRRARRRVSGE